MSSSSDTEPSGGGVSNPWRSPTPNDGTSQSETSDEVKQESPRSPRSPEEPQSDASEEGPSAGEASHDEQLPGSDLHQELAGNPEEPHNTRCPCASCTRKFIEACTARDKTWCRDHHWSRVPSFLNFLIHGARTAMFDRRRGLYLPSEFDPERFCDTGDSMEPKNMFKTRVFDSQMLPNFHPYRYVMHIPRQTGPSSILITMMLMFIDGHCTNEGSAGASAGYGFAYSAKGSKRAPTRAAPKTATGWIPGRVESFGPNGIYGEQTSKRAELRAIIAALEWRYWYREG